LAAKSFRSVPNPALEADHPPTSIISVKAARFALEALGSSIPKPEFVHLDAGFEHFTKKGNALPEETIEYVS
jgi:hypothetical protein